MDLTKAILIPHWNITELNGYVPITTFWEDFSIADKFGINAVKDTFNRAFHEWKGDYKYLTELVLVTNHKSWEHSKSNLALSEVYADLYHKANEYAWDTLNGEELTYFFNVTD